MPWLPLPTAAPWSWAVRGAKACCLQDWDRDVYLFVVYKHSMMFRLSVRLGDLVEAVSTLELGSAYSGRFSQRIECAGEPLVQAEVDVVRVDAQQNLRRFPPR